MQVEAPPATAPPIPLAAEVEEIGVRAELPEPAFVSETAQHLAAQAPPPAPKPKVESFFYGGFDIAGPGAIALAEATGAARSRIEPPPPPVAPHVAEAGRSKLLAALPEPSFVGKTVTSHAAESPPPDLPKRDRESFIDNTYAIVGIGMIGVPEYAGASKSRTGLGAGAIGKLGGIGFRLRGPNLTTDLYNDPPGRRIGLRIGPSIRYSANRHGKASDPAVAALGKLKGVVEAGLGAGFSIKKLASKYDSLGVGVGARWSLSGKRGGANYSASASYLTPVSHTQVAGLHASAGFSSGRLARFNYSISPAGSLASGLPAYRARGGLTETSAAVFTGWSLKGDLRNRGPVIGGGVMYTRLHGSAARSPITSLRGSRNQWAFGVGIGYRL